MALLATLEPAGAGVSGQQTKGITAQYQLDGTKPTPETPNVSGVHPYDSGTIVINTKPGHAPEKLVSGIVQRSSQLLCTLSPGAVGNALTATSGVGLIPTVPAGSNVVDGLSQAPNHE